MNELTVYDTSVDFAVSAWLDEKRKRSGSERTYRAYKGDIASLRAGLFRIGRDLDSDPRRVALVLQAWASAGMDGEVSAATHNRRVASVSSFYRYCRRHQLLEQNGQPIANPAEMVERRPNQRYRNALPINRRVLSDRLNAIDRMPIRGKRDFALLVIALTTGRRLTEIASMKWEDVSWSDGGHTMLVQFPRTKGGKSMRDTLTQAATQALHTYGTALADELLYGEYIWVSLRGNQHKPAGSPLTIRAIENICLSRLGTSKFHSLRHTFAHLMEESGASLSEIQHRLGHTDASTTSIYLQAMRSDENKYADDIVAKLGIVANQE